MVSDVTETVTYSIISGIGSVIVASIGAWAVVHTRKSKDSDTAQPRPLQEPSMTDRVFDDLMDRVENLERQLNVTADRARHWEVEAAKLKTELVAAKKTRSSDALLISRLRARVDEFERQARNDG